MYSEPPSTTPRSPLVVVTELIEHEEGRLLASNLAFHSDENSGASARAAGCEELYYYDLGELVSLA